MSHVQESGARGARSIGALAASALSSKLTAVDRLRRSGAVHRTGAPVLRGSLEEGSFEDAFFAVPAPGEPDRMLKLARRACDQGRRLKRRERSTGEKLSVSERKLVAITPATVRLFEAICDFARTCAGRVYPSWERLAEDTALGRATVGRALEALVNAGFLVRQRRFKRRTQEDGSMRYEQTSTAYRPLLPAALLKLLPRWMRPAPLPDDHLQREADRQEDNTLMLSSLSCRELARVTISDSPLARALASYGSRLDAHGASTIMGSKRCSS